MTLSAPEFDARTIGGPTAMIARKHVVAMAWELGPWVTSSRGIGGPSRPTTTTLRRSTPTLADAATCGCIVSRTSHQHYPVQVNGVPFMSVRFERKSLLSV